MPGASGKLYWARVVESPLVSVRVATRGADCPIDTAIKKALAGDKRYLHIDIQGDGELPFWQMCVAWGSGASAARRMVRLGHDQHDPSAIVRLIQAILASEEFSLRGQPLDAVELSGSVLDYRDPFDPVAVEDSESSR